MGSSRTLAVDSDGCSYGFGSAWNFALACRGSVSSFVFCAVVAAAIAAIVAVIAAFAAAIAAVIAVLLFRRSRWLLCASLAVWLYLDFMSLLKSSCKRLNPRPNPRT
jgi:pimeloyl-ACP methyl ester carboxylesterase